tara:strand:+ start:994 stop:1689 length:696 start_codon:yes stop_codon:yes gene_type:complete
MAFKWTEGQHRSGNILDADEFNTSFNAFKGEINGGLDRENLPNASISNDELASNAMVKYSVETGICLQEAVLATATWLNSSSAGAVNQQFRCTNYNHYTGGWVTNNNQKINSLYQEGMLHIEYNGWYWLQNHIATQGAFRSGANQQKWCQFEIAFDGNAVVTSGRHYQNVGQVHLVTDIPITTGQHEIALRWRVSANPDQSTVTAPTSGTELARPIFYYDGGQITVVNRYR